MGLLFNGTAFRRLPEKPRCLPLSPPAACSPFLVRSAGGRSEHPVSGVCSPILHWRIGPCLTTPSHLAGRSGYNVQNCNTTAPSVRIYPLAVVDPDRISPAIRNPMRKSGSRVCQTSGKWRLDDGLVCHGVPRRPSWISPKRKVGMGLRPLRQICETDLNPMHVCFGPLQDELMKTR